MPEVFFAWLQPVVLATSTVTVLAWWLRRDRPHWPPPMAAIAWIVAPTVLNPFIWRYAAPMFGWELGGLGGVLYFYRFLPWNGFLVGITATPALSILLPRHYSTLRRTFVGIGVEGVLLFTWLGVASQFRAYVGNLSS